MDFSGSSTATSGVGQVGFAPVTMIGAGDRNGFDWQSWVRSAGAAGSTSPQLQATGPMGASSPVLVIAMVLLLTLAVAWFARR